LADVAVDRAGTAEVDVAVHHLSSPTRAAQLADALRMRVPNLRELRVSEVGAVVGAHVGPGMLAVAVSPV
jgi:fatty acid-binding protein DegV